MADRLRFHLLQQVPGQEGTERQQQERLRAALAAAVGMEQHQQERPQRERRLREHQPQGLHREAR